MLTRLNPSSQILHGNQQILVAPITLQARSRGRPAAGLSRGAIGKTTIVEDRARSHQTVKFGACGKQVFHPAGVDGDRIMCELQAIRMASQKVATSPRPQTESVRFGFCPSIEVKPPTWLVVADRNFFVPPGGEYIFRGASCAPPSIVFWVARTLEIIARQNMP